MDRIVFFRGFYVTLFTSRIFLFVLLEFTSEFIQLYAYLSHHDFSIREIFFMLVISRAQLRDYTSTLDHSLLRKAAHFHTRFAVNELI
jgi:hypothetical protein